MIEFKDFEKAMHWLSGVKNPVRFGIHNFFETFGLLIDTKGHLIQINGNEYSTDQGEKELRRAYATYIDQFYSLYRDFIDVLKRTSRIIFVELEKDTPEFMALLGLSRMFFSYEVYDKETGLEEIKLSYESAMKPSDINTYWKEVEEFYLNPSIEFSYLADYLRIRQALRLLGLEG